VQTPSLLANLPPEDAQRVLRSARRRIFEAGEVICHEGDIADTLHFIVSGRVAATVTSLDGRQLTLSVLGKDEYFGELALLSADSLRSATIRTLEATETRSIHRDDFEALRREHGRLSDLLLYLLATRVRRLSSLLQEALHVPVEIRIRRRLLELASIYDDAGRDTVIPLTQEQLAEIAGTARGTVNRVLRQEESHGSLRLGRQRVTILDTRGLRRRAGSA
jgi:CRP-like cAMP-binding protein